MTNKHIKGSKILGTILNLLIFLVMIIMLFGIYYIVQIKVQNKEYANMFGYTFFEVATGSMSPTIEIGDVVIAELTDNVKVNDIVIFKQDDNYITHRITKIDNEFITTKGDANNSEDKEIYKNQILGKVIFTIPKVSIWKKVLSTPIVSVSIIITFVLFGIAFSYEFKDDSKKENKYVKQKKT